MPALRSLLSLSLALVAARADEGINFFESKIRPVLVENCYDCHSAQAKKLKGGLSLDTREGLLRGGELGPAIVPGKPDESRLLQAIRYERDLEMPPEERLPAPVVADFEKWIALGAPDPRSGPATTSAEPEIDIEAGRRHWSFQPITDPPVPDHSDLHWARTDVDRFVVAKLRSKNLHPVRDATPLELLRRASFDLTGLPPSSAEVRRFAKLGIAEIEPAFDALVKRLLNSRAFGERWGRHWLDVARYADSTGGTHNLPYRVAFRYRDYVVNAFNDDKPYDQFLREQIAGDLLPFENDSQRNEQLTATGFLCVGLKELAERDTRRFEALVADEQIDTVGRALLGLTIACARCHDHKFDPIPTKDYYALAGIFTSSEAQTGAWRNRHRSTYVARLQQLAGSGREFTDEDMREYFNHRVDSIRPRLNLRDEKRRLLKAAGLLNAKQRAQDKFVAEQPELQKLIKDIERRDVVIKQYADRYHATLPRSVMAMRDRPKPADMPVYLRGNDRTRGEIVPRGFPQVLTNANTPTINTNQSGRLELANWIASPDNPLTARVYVNRVWQHLFGIGLVDTPDDFGKTGQPPANPSILDHLATRFMEDDWSTKRLLRYLMKSRVYRLSTRHNPAAWEIDPDNRFNWRMTRRRLDANAIGDSLLLLSGRLRSGAPPNDQLAKYYRDNRMKSIDRQGWIASAKNYRMMYQPLWREYIPDELTVFDFPEPAFVAGRRGLTTVPTQALYLMNNTTVAEYAAAAARRLQSTSPGDRRFIEAAYLAIFNRPPKHHDLIGGIRFLKSYREFGEQKKFTAHAAFCQSLFAAAEFRYLF